MIAWTDSAKKVWADYLDATKATLDGTGADPQEVMEDLQRHVDQEVSDAKLTVVTEDDLRKILRKIGAPEAAKAEGQKPLGPAVPDKTDSPKFSKLLAGFLFFLAVLMPVITILFEWFTGASAADLFDPIPTWFHIVIVAMVPLGNAWLWLAILRNRARHERWLGWLNGFVLGVCIYYSVLYIFFAPIACIAVIYFGLGLIPLTPYLALIGTWALRYQYHRLKGGVKLPDYLAGALIALACLLALQLPESLTFYGLARAGSEDAATRDYGIKVLRFCGNRTVMLRACYGLLQRREFPQPLDLLATGTENLGINSNLAREIYYRVTGDAFNAVPPPKFYTRAGRWTALDDEYVWDDGLGGDQVAGRVKGLSLLSSRMDATTEPNAGLSYCEWTMEFKNVSALNREARAQIALPPGAVVSRVTLWIDGEEREAAFGGRSQTREAYKSVAIQQRRDPLLVTTCGPDRILVQCFPIPMNGGIMKIRIGITVPLILDSLASGNFIWPHFLERNFGIAADFKHSLWLAKPDENNQLTSIHESLAETSLSAGLHSTAVRRRADIDTVWAPGETAGQFIRQTIRPMKVSTPSRIVVVLDGSGGMGQYLPEIVRELDQIPDTAEIALVVASDEAQGKSEIQKATAGNKALIQRELRHQNFTGGQDNLPALESAWDLADAATSGAVVWIHLVEPFPLSSDSGICQRLERNFKPTRLYDVQLNNGPDRLVEKLDGLPSIEHVVSWVPGQNRFDRLLNIWTGHSQAFEFTRQLTNDLAGLSQELRASKHLARLWARDESLRLAGSRQAAAATKLAAQNQLITPLTGAVVLETKAQYDRFNLSPADPSTVPEIPEPANLTIIALVIALYLIKRRLKARKEAARD